MGPVAWGPVAASPRAARPGWRWLCRARNQERHVPPAQWLQARAMSWNRTPRGQGSMQQPATQV